jgi:putative transposase
VDGGEKTVLKLMRALGLVCKVRRRKRYNSYQGDQGRIAPNLLNREFDATAPNQKWVTEFSVGDRKLYLSPVMDLFARQIISYAIGSSPNLELTTHRCVTPWDCLRTGRNRWCTRTKASSTSASPGALSSSTPMPSSPCPARATATTTP